VCAAVAHGIRNPLAAISSSAQLGLAHGSADENTRSRLQDILTECRRLDQRVTRLIGFASTVSPAPKPFNLRDVVDQAVHELRPKLDEREITLTVVFELDAVLHGDRERMIQCVIELLSNSLEYTPPCGRIDIKCVECTERPGFVDLYVADTGPGIPLDVMDRVFDLFFSTRPGGTGIGLASVRHTVHGHGGEVMAVPNAGNGARIRLTLPILHEADRPAHGERR
jgi:signal transduction histidine kinase